jgi:hypothetical protein
MLGKNLRRAGHEIGIDTTFGIFVGILLLLVALPALLLGVSTEFSTILARGIAPPPLWLRIIVMTIGGAGTTVGLVSLGAGLWGIAEPGTKLYRLTHWRG